MNQSEKSIKKRKVNSDYVLLSKEVRCSSIYLFYFFFLISLLHINSNVLHYLNHCITSIKN